MLHRLALALGRTVGELERTMSVREFADWMRFEPPMPYELLDFHFGQLLAMIFNANKSASQSAAQPRDYMVLVKREKPKETGSIAQRMKAIAEQQ